MKWRPYYVFSHLKWIFNYSAYQTVIPLMPITMFLMRTTDKQQYCCQRRHNLLIHRAGVFPFGNSNVKIQEYLNRCPLGQQLK
jgi:hypothetical protein